MSNFSLADVNYLLKYIANDSNYNLSIQEGDYNNDGKIDLADVNYLLKHITNDPNYPLESKFIRKILGLINTFKLRRPAYLKIIKDDEILIEKYYLDKYNKDYSRNCWSVSKTIGTLIFGVLIDMNLVTLDNTLYDIFPNEIENIISNLDDNNWSKKITMKDYLSLNIPFRNDYRTQAKDISTFIRLMESDPKLINTGTVNYAPNMDILSYVMTKLIVENTEYKDVLEFANNKLFFKYSDEGLTELEIIGKYNNSNVYYFTIGINLKFKYYDFIANLILKKGNYNNKQLVSEKFIINMITLSNFYTSIRNYCLGIWTLNKNINTISDNVIAIGLGGKYIFVFYKYNLIINIVFDNDTSFSHDRLIQSINNIVLSYN